MTADDGSLLVVDDELFLRGAVAASLRFLGFDVAVAENGTDALRLARATPFDLLILDVVLPDVDGFEIVRRLRREGNLVPVIFLTAKDTQDDKVTGLTIGGDDYMTKPFGLEELAARVRTVLRRTRPVPAEPVLIFADLTLDQDTYEVRRDGRLIELSPTEFRAALLHAQPAGAHPRPALTTCGTTTSADPARWCPPTSPAALWPGADPTNLTQRAVGWLLRLPCAPPDPSRPKRSEAPGGYR
jgi:two-component system OmpR family response regulator